MNSMPDEEKTHNQYSFRRVGEWEATYLTSNIDEDIDYKSWDIGVKAFLTCPQTEVIDKSWGREIPLCHIHDEDNSLYYGSKALIFEEKQSGSEHYHERKHETFRIIEGTGVIFLDEDTIVYKPQDIIIIPPNQRHLIISNEYTVILETYIIYADNDETIRTFRFNKEDYNAQ